MNDRDHFAAAALTGLLAAPTDKDRSMDYWARLAYESAEAVLRERQQTIGPAPAADGTDWPTSGAGPSNGTDAQNKTGKGFAT
jgi:hypothetical protein